MILTFTTPYHGPIHIAPEHIVWVREYYQNQLEGQQYAEGEANTTINTVTSGVIHVTEMVEDVLEEWVRAREMR
jgi:hypothetical protein